MISPPDVRLHKCDECGAVAPWSAAWSWWGSVIDLEDGVVLRFCSDECRGHPGAPALIRRLNAKRAKARLGPSKLRAADIRAVLGGL